MNEQQQSQDTTSATHIVPLRRAQQLLPRIVEAVNTADPDERVFVTVEDERGRKVVIVSEDEHRRLCEAVDELVERRSLAALSGRAAEGGARSRTVTDAELDALLDKMPPAPAPGSSKSKIRRR